MKSVAFRLGFFMAIAGMSVIPKARLFAQAQAAEPVQMVPLLAAQLQGRVRPGMLAPQRGMFDQVVFSDGGSFTVLQATLQSELELRVAQLERVAELSPIQKSKLLLAGRGDIGRLLNRIKEVRERLTSTDDADRNQEIFQEAAKLKSEIKEDRFGTGSLFDKVQRNILSEEQNANIQREIQASLELKRRQTEMVAVQFIENRIPLLSVQRDALLALAVQHSQSKDGSIRELPEVLLGVLEGAKTQVDQILKTEDQRETIERLRLEVQMIRASQKQEGGAQ